MNDSGTDTGRRGARGVTGRGAQRREEILAAAAALFARRGFHGVTIDDIGAAAGMSGPGIYRHFPGKEAVLAEMLVGISERLLAEGSRRSVAAPDAPGALEALLDWHVSFALSQPDLITVQTRELASVPEPARRQVRRLQRLYVEEWVSVLSELSPLTPPARLRTALHGMFGLLNSTPHSASELPADAMAELLHTMARGALAAASAPPADAEPPSRLAGEAGAADETGLRADARR
ncbi:MAG TPA: helix-turn-helix domain-containing protein [Trebonia sp.]